MHLKCYLTVGISVNLLVIASSFTSRLSYFVLFFLLSFLSVLFLCGMGLNYQSCYRTDKIFVGLGYSINVERGRDVLMPTSC